MITEIWVWYDESEGDVPTIIKAGEVATLFDARFCDFYGWAQCHGSEDYHGFSHPDRVSGFLVRPLYPCDVTRGRVNSALSGHPGIVGVEVKGVDFLGDGAVRKVRLLFKR